VAEKAMEKEVEEAHKEKNWKKKTDYFSNFSLRFLDLNAWNPLLFIGGGRVEFYLYWCQILALDSTRKDLNRWLKVVIMNSQYNC
jgi:hypothetical protein